MTSILSSIGCHVSSEVRTSHAPSNVQGDSYCAICMNQSLEEICDKIHKLACKVNKSLHHLYHSSMEEQYQSALSYEFNKAKLVYHVETVVQLQYRDFPLKESEADFVICPGGPNKFDENIVMEVKNSSFSKPNKDKARLQLFTYLNSGPKNSNPLLSEVRHGLVLHWPVQDEKALMNDDGTASLASPVKTKPTMELWKTTDSKGTKFKLLKEWG